nr:unnamed protein product [Callosobruchus chinensis]
MSYLMYYDINNLYGAAMSKHLPYGGFEWVPIENIYHEDILNQPDDSDYGYILEVDLNYPADLFSLHKDLQLCPEHLAPPTSNSEMKKLLSTLCLKFKQAPWIKTYIDLNTELRTRSRNEFEKNFFKLMNNSPYGMAILDISKTFLYDFHYNYIKQQFNDKAKLLYCDTDSLVYHFFIDDIYHHMKKDIFRYDTSDYSENNQFGMPRKNKKVLGLMKDENNGKIMTHFIGLRSKMYTFKVMSTITENDWIVSKKAKGIQRSALKEITFDDYYKCLMDRRQVEIQQNFITTSKHNVYTASQKKVALSPYDDKRMVNYLYTDTLPWGFNDKTRNQLQKRRNKGLYLHQSTQKPHQTRKSFFASVKIMVKTHVTPEQAAYEEQLGRLSRQPIVRYNLLRLYSVGSERNQLSKNDLARLFLKTPEVKEVPIYQPAHATLHTTTTTTTIHTHIHPNKHQMRRRHCVCVYTTSIIIIICGGMLLLLLLLLLLLIYILNIFQFHDARKKYYQLRSFHTQICLA